MWKVKQLERTDSHPPSVNALSLKSSSYSTCFEWWAFKSLKTACNELTHILSALIIIRGWIQLPSFPLQCWIWQWMFDRTGANGLDWIGINRRVCCSNTWPQHVPLFEVERKATTSLHLNAFHGEWRDVGQFSNYLCVFYPQSKQLCIKQYVYSVDYIWQWQAKPVILVEGESS